MWEVNMHQPKMLHSVTLSRSEGSVALGIEMLRCAQYDNVRWLTTPRALIKLSAIVNEPMDCSIIVSSPKKCLTSGCISPL